MLDRLKAIVSKPKQSTRPQTIEEAIQVNSPRSEAEYTSQKTPQKSSLEKHFGTMPTQNNLTHKVNDDLTKLQDFLLENNLDVSKERCEAWLEIQPFDVIINNVELAIANDETNTAELEHIILTNAAAAQYSDIAEKEHLDDLELPPFSGYSSEEHILTEDGIANLPEYEPSELELLLEQLSLKLEDILDFYAEYDERYILAQLKYMLTRKQNFPISSPKNWIKTCIKDNYAQYRSSDDVAHADDYTMNIDNQDGAHSNSTSSQVELEQECVLSVDSQQTSPETEIKSKIMTTSEKIENKLEVVTLNHIQASVVKTKWQIISSFTSAEFTNLLMQSNCYCSSEFCIHYQICYFRRDGKIHECEACRTGISDMLNKPIEFIKNIEV